MDVHSEVSNPEHKRRLKDVYYGDGGIPHLIEGRHLQIFASAAPNTSILLNTIVAAIEFRSKGVSATPLFENHYEGDFAVFWLSLTGARYDAGMSFCPMCGKYPPPRWYHMLGTSELYEEIHHNTVTPACLSSPFFEELEY
jgi:hypothetical protein